MASAVKNLVREMGILSNRNPNPGKTLNQTTAELVVNFYNSDEVSRMMPGKNNCVTIRNKSIKLQAQKRLTNLQEIYQLFKEKCPHHIGFSKFCELRPKNCVLAGKSGSMCTLHQNIKLMMSDARLQNFVLDRDDTLLTSYHTCLAKIMCNPPSFQCYLDNCQECHGLTQLEELTTKKFNDELIDEITYKQWVTVDRCQWKL